jgi:hypothetical protein
MVGNVIHLCVPMAGKSFILAPMESPAPFILDIHCTKCPVPVNRVDLPYSEGQMEAMAIAYQARLGTKCLSCRLADRPGGPPPRVVELPCVMRSAGRVEQGNWNPRDIDITYFEKEEDAAAYVEQHMQDKHGCFNYKVTRVPVMIVGNNAYQMLQIKLQ